MSGIYLTRRDPSRNLARFYHLFVAPNLWGEWCLFREWGRIGSGGQVKTDRFDNAGAALLALQDIVRLKKKRGYNGQDSGKR